MSNDNLDKLIALFDGDAGAAVSCQSLIEMAIMLNAAPLERAVAHLERADTLGPFFDPTAYRDAIYSGRLEHSQECFSALLDFVHRVQASASKIAERAAAKEVAGA